MITYGGRVLNTYKKPDPIPIKGGSDTINSSIPNPIDIHSSQSGHSSQSVQSIPNDPLTSPTSDSTIITGGGITLETINNSIKTFLKESPKEIYYAMREASVVGTPLGQFLGPFAWPVSWILWILSIAFTLFYYFIVFCFVMIIIKVIQMGLNLVHAALGGVLAPLKAVYGIKIAGGRLFGFLGGPVRSLQKTQDSIAKTVIQLFINIMKKMLE